MKPVETPKISKYVDCGPDDRAALIADLDHDYASDIERRASAMIMTLGREMDAGIKEVFRLSEENRKLRDRAVDLRKQRDAEIKKRADW
ncbi:hypothetical protein DL1_08710 [Thioclava dalianensis]|uniref:Uncharacterized protein n=2 Tax=Thioclava dalianensis TaxID=1185766 RepID=A0A074TIL5_9RHOB|nr:hypothetical protein DL1_08710 [Thioclava dalianensis]